MISLLIIVTVAIVTSAICSLCEAVLYSVPLSYIETLAKEKRRSGLILQGFRRDVERPIGAILALNTVANAAGAALAGAVVAKVFGPEWLVWFSVGFTAVILIFSEILPKSIGVLHSRALATYIAVPLEAVVWILKPLVWVCHLSAKLVKPDSPEPVVSASDLLSMAAVGVESGTVDIEEANVIQNMLNLDSKTVVNAMTHRSMVTALPANMPVEEAHVHSDAMVHGRVLVYGSDLDDILGIVYRRELFSAAADDLHQTRLKDLMHPVDFVRDITPLDDALKLFLEQDRAQRIFVVVDEHGGTDGIITLEDILEEILGKEIDGEFTEVSEKKAVTLRRRKKIMGQILETTEGAG
jgi:CBS domain containing-hemolysin-like protein